MQQNPRKNRRILFGLFVKHFIIVPERNIRLNYPWLYERLCANWQTLETLAEVDQTCTVLADVLAVAGRA